jgi:hypothetical protein
MRDSDRGGFEYFFYELSFLTHFQKKLKCFYPYIDNHMQHNVLQDNRTGQYVRLINQLHRIHHKYDGNWIYTLAMCK